ncbi:family 3 glycoside hydrolase [Cryphonectria parasitica EP155]|uniref:Beta-glucosidase cel3A n=1 Tax=Cryphonectria parasitica (strain ATCC 38755 / EP155) TaxID=660469 RepID=A0A9P4YDC7_CRYP1|nr:family 3 glycoside hydrolase [Cryphonectria parasitica EP155]KAF3770909.1 family 3 glycoside hydrolase [Cryphonectria parasitica EP155]
MAPSTSAGLHGLLAASLFTAASSADSVSPRDAVPSGFVAAPYYPAPYTGWIANWTESVEKAKALVDTMTLAEKANITAGTGIYMGVCVGMTGSAPRVGFPQLCLQDSALGVRDTDNITAFPAGVTTGATWDKDLIYQRGVAIGEEFRGKGANVYLGPVVAPLGRKPRDGRSWEGFGADPVLSGKGAALTIQGVQEQGVMATIKHLIGYEQEMWREYNIIQPGYSANIDDRTMHELYLWPFAEAVRAGVVSAMAAYNAVNGSACSQNSYLINNLFKDELGFQGFIMSDWLAQMSGVASALAGLDMGMPGDTIIPLLGYSYWMYEMTTAVLNGSTPVDRLDDAAVRIVAAWYQMGQDNDYPEPNFSSYSTDAVGLLHPGALSGPTGVINQFVDVRGDHAVVAREVARDGITMLKNDDNLLPLSTDTPLFLFGTDQAVNPDGPNACVDRSCDTGTLGMGWGSGTARYETFNDPLTAIQANATNVTSFNTDSFPSDVGTVTDDDVAIVFITSDSGENSYTVEGNAGDRSSSGLVAWYDGDELVEAAAAKFSNVIVVVHTVAPIIVEPWYDLDSVKAILFAHLPGQEAGYSLTDVLFGAVSPSGHLPYTIPVAEDDYPSSVSLTGFAFGQIQDTYTEGLYIDYRYLNKVGTKPRYAFGHGLSYTNFTYTNATITKVTQLTTLPASRTAKSGLPSYNTTIPPASEAYKPADYDEIYVDRYLYPWLSDDDAAAAAATGEAVAAGTNSGYDYPEGYSTTQTAGPAAGGGLGGNPALFETAYTISVVVTNVGSGSTVESPLSNSTKRATTGYSGKAVAQAYVQYPDSDYDTPIIQLRDFEKTDTLAVGESQTVELTFTRKDVSVWDVVEQNWVVPVVDGAYKFWIGEASDALYLACGADTLTCEEDQTPPV